VVAPAHLAMGELVQHESSGLLFAPENTLYGEDTRSRFAHTLPPPRRFLEALRRPSDAYVDGLAAALARLAEEPGLHARLAAGAFEQVRSGRFSLERRREALAALYAAAVS
jgi:glycosyltransferase involved in cell wall biosynthesis